MPLNYFIIYLNYIIQLISTRVTRAKRQYLVVKAKVVMITVRVGTGSNDDLTYRIGH